MYDSITEITTLWNETQLNGCRGSGVRDGGGRDVSREARVIIKRTTAGLPVRRKPDHHT